MILYVCRQCGRWQDVSLAQTLQKSLLDAMFANASTEQKNAMMDANVFDCPDGHGAMMLADPTKHRLMVIEQLDKEQG